MPPAAHVYPYEYEPAAFNQRSTNWASICHRGGPPSNPDYADLRNSTGRGPSSQLPVGRGPSFIQWFFGKK